MFKCLLSLLAINLLIIEGFVPSKRSVWSTSTSLSVSVERRKALLTRPTDEPYFCLESDGQIEFGATAQLVTPLDNKKEVVEQWLLQDEQSLALSIWENAKEIRPGIYRLKVMKLQFVSLQLEPTVDMEMKTFKSTLGDPVFCIHSVQFDPNIQIIPGVKAESLDIVIEVAGQLMATSNGVRGAIAFSTQGRLPPPLRLVPEPLLRAAANAINQSIVRFAVKSFEQGARAKFQEYLLESRV